MSEDKKKMARGGPPPTGADKRKHSGSLCTATRRDGSQCTNFSINGATVCRMHGGSAPQVRRAAQVRLLMQADHLMAALLKIALDPKLPVQHRLVAIRDGLDRANLSGTQSVELTVEKGRSFEDVTADVVMDLDMSDDDKNVVDAEVIEDDDHGPLVPHDADDIPPARTRGDRNFEAAIERGRRSEIQRMRSGGMSEAERARREAEALAQTETAKPNDSRGRAAYLAALDAGASHADAERAARRAVEGSDNSGKRRARVSKATMTDRRAAR
jgi:hypothetical protein